MRPVGGQGNVSVLHRVVMYVVEACPEVLFIPHHSIPVVVPDSAARRFVQPIQFEGSPSVQALNEDLELVCIGRFSENMVVVVQHHPCAKFDGVSLCVVEQKACEQSPTVQSSKKVLSAERSGRDEAP